MIEIEINGKAFTEFISAEVTDSLEEMANSFSFTASSVNGFPPFNLGDTIECYVHDDIKVTGVIEQEEGNEQEGSHSYTYSGRDFTSDLIDSQVSQLAGISGNISLKSLIESVIDNIDSDLSVIDLVQPAIFNIAEDAIKEKDGSQCISIISEYAKKRQCLLTSNHNGDLVIIRDNPTKTKVKLLRRDKTEGNILSQNWTRTSTNRFNNYIHKGQIKPSQLNYAGITGISQPTAQKGSATDAEIRQGRQSVIVESKSYSNKQLIDRALWSKQLSKAKSFRYNCATQGHLDPLGNQWNTNSLVFVESDTARINQQLLLNTITWIEGEGVSTIAQLEFVQKDVYTIGGG